MFERGHLLPRHRPWRSSDRVHFLSRFMRHHASLGGASLAAQVGRAVLGCAPPCTQSMTFRCCGAIDSQDASGRFSSGCVVDVHIDGLIGWVSCRHAVGHVGATSEEHLEDLAVLAKVLVGFERRDGVLVGDSIRQALNVDLSLLLDPDVGQDTSTAGLCILLFPLALLLGQLQSPKPNFSNLSNTPRSMCFSLQRTLLA